MSAKCTAPVNGHSSFAGALVCPVHGTRGTKPVGDSPFGTAPPSYAPSPKEVAATWAAKRPYQRGREAGKSDDPDVIELAANDSSNNVRAYVCVNPLLPADLLVDLVEDRDAKVRAGAARAEGLTPDQARALSSAILPTIREALARNSAITADIALSLARDDPNPFVRNVALQNPTLPQEFMASTLEEGWPGDRSAVLGNPALADETLSGYVDATPPGRSTVRTAAVRIRDERIRKKFGIDRLNAAAVEAVAELDWWDEEPGSPAILLTMATRGNL